MKQRLRKSLLYLLGFSSFPILTSCYGMPQDYEPYYEPDFELKGRVLTKDMKPIEGISVFFPFNAESNNYSEIYSDENGEFTVYGKNINAKVIFSDVDGAANGGFFVMGKTITFKDIQNNGDVIMQRETLYR